MSNTVTPTAAFGLDLLKKEAAARPGKNILISPLSVSLALGMTASGAGGSTLCAINRGLGLDADQGANNKGYAALMRQLRRDNIGVTLSIANAIFARLGTRFKSEFREIVEGLFYALMDEVDFDDPHTFEDINGFVSDATGGKIDRLLDGPIGRDAVMFLVNCVYFNGQWTRKFDKCQTTNLPFAGVGEIPLMFRNEKMIYGRDANYDTYQLVSLPFGHCEEVRMLVLLPDPGKTVNDVLAKLDEPTLAGHISMNYKQQGCLWLPRIEIGYSNSLNDSLKAMGMTDAFADADFSGMVPPPAQVCISDVQHKTFFKVDEDGAEGAAATSVGMTLQCATRPFAMKVDRPFVTFVVDSKTNAVLFAGVITDPTR